MRKLYRVVIMGVLVGLLLMDSWAFVVSSEVQSTPDRRVTQPLQYIDDPLVGNITLVARPTMFEGVPTSCELNMTLSINSKIPMDLTINDIMITFTSSKSGEPVEIGSLSWGAGSTMMSIANTTGLQIWGAATIRPSMTSEGGNYSLGVGISYALRNHTQGPNAWGGTDGALYMIQVNLIPAIFQPEGWNAAFWLTLLAVCVTYIIDRHYQFL